MATASSAGGYARLEEGNGGAWPSRAALMELMEERTVELLREVAKDAAAPAEALCRALGASPTEGLAGDDLAERVARSARARGGEDHKL